MEGNRAFPVVLIASTALHKSSLAVTGDALITRAAIEHLYYTPTFKTNVLHLASNERRLEQLLLLLIQHYFSLLLRNTFHY